MHAIEVEGLTKTYPGGVDAVKPLHFDVAPGEVFGLLGPNGAGKSTTVGMLTTTIAPTAGTRAPGRLRRRAPVARRPPREQRRLPGAGGRPHAHRPREPRAPRAPVGRGAEPRATRGSPSSSTRSASATLVDRPVGTYSGGERRRLEIARALVSEPRVLFLDEPTVGLDPRIRHELLDVIAGLRERSEMTILLTTHYLDEAQRLCDRVAIMNRGEIVALDAPGALLAGLGGEILEMRLDGDAEAALATLRAHGIATADVFTVGSTMTLPLRRTSAAEAIAAIHATDVRASGITTRTPTLDDVYLRLTGNPMAEAA